MSSLIRVVRWSVVFFALGLGGCATLPADTIRSPKDPFERFNRAVFSFNEDVDSLVLRPVARAYDAWVHEGLRQMVSNFFGNISDVVSAANNLLQGKVEAAARHTFRFGLNSTLGFAGLIDFATPMGLERHREDFGQTLGVWGVPSGAFLMLPILGPSTARDSIGTAIDSSTEPLPYVVDGALYYGLTGLKIVNVRASLLGGERVINGMAFDRYTLIRDTYLARRRNLIYDGDPPEEIENDDAAVQGP